MWIRSVATLETHVQKLEAEYEKLNEDMARGELEGFNAKSGSQLRRLN